jgi:hypothetical protein
MVHGKDLILSINDTAIAAAQSCDIDFGADFIETCSPVSGEWKDYVPTVKSWGCSANILCKSMDYFNELQQKFDWRQKVTLRFWDNNMGCFYKGDAYIKSLKTGGSVGSLVKASVDFQTTGALQRAEKVEINPAFWTQHSMRQRIVFFALTGRCYVYLKETSYTMVFYHTVTFNKMTRIHVTNQVVVLRATAAETETMLTNLNTEAFNSAAVLYAGNEKEADRVVPAGTYTFVSDLGSYYSGGFYIEAI